MIQFSYNSLCNIPAFFYPTTIALVDDEPEFMKTTSMALAKDYKTICFSDPNKALKFFSQKGKSHFKGKVLSSKYNGDITPLRNAIYNSQRFEDIFATVLDYDIPGRDGFDVLNNLGLIDYYNNNFFAYLLLTAQPYSEFADKAQNTPVADNFISKWDPTYAKQLVTRIDYLSARLFQWIGHLIAITLALDPSEKTSFLFDGNFLPIFNDYLKQQDIYEGYLFDKQGSLLLLDKQGQLSWLLVRNEQGIKNSIQMASDYGAPQSILEALKSKKYILSLYEKMDFQQQKKFCWDDYLVPAEVFKDKELEVFRHHPSDYYFAFIENIPWYKADTSRILSYETFLRKK